MFNKLKLYFTLVQKYNYEQKNKSSKDKIKETEKLIEMLENIHNKKSN